MSQTQRASSNARDAAELQRAELRELGAQIVGRHHEAPQQHGPSLGFLLRGLPSFQASVAAPSRRPPRKRSAATRQQELAAEAGAGQQEDEPDAAAGPWQPVTMERLRTVFHLPREQAAQELGLGLSSLKRCCATLNIQRWPHRKLQSLMGLMQHHVKNPLPEPEQQELMSLIQDEYNATLLNPDHELHDALLVKRVNKYKKVYSRKMTEIQRQRRMQENAAAAAPAAPAAPPAPARRASSSGKQPQSTCRHEELNMGVPGVEAAAPHAAGGVHSAADNQLQLGTAAAAVKQEPQHACSAARVGPVRPGTAHVSPSIGSCSTGQSLEAAGAARAHGPLAGLQLHVLPTFPSLPGSTLPAAMAVDDALPAAKKRAGAAAANVACPRASTGAAAAAAGKTATGALAGMALPAWPAVPTSNANFTLERGNTSAQGSPRGTGKGSRARRSQPGGTAKPVTLQQLGGPWGMGLTRTQPLQDPPSFQLWSTQHGVSSWGVAGTAMDGGLGSMTGDALPPPSSLLDSTGPGADGHQVLQQRGSNSVGGHNASVVLPKAEPLVVDGQPLATHPRLGWSSAGGALGVHSWDPSLLATYPSAQPQHTHEGWVLSSPRSAAAGTGAGAPTQLPFGRVVRGMHAGPLRAASVLSNVTVGYDSGECGGGLGYSVLTSGGLNSYSSTEGGPELHVQQQLLDLQLQELQRQLQQQEQQQQQVAREGMATSSRASGQPSLSYMVPLEHGATQAGLCTTLLGTGPLSTTVENELESGTAGSQTMPGTARTASGIDERPAAAASARGAHALLQSAPVLQFGTGAGTGPPSGSDGDASSTAARLPARNSSGATAVGNGGGSQGPAPAAATWTLPAWPAPLSAAARGAHMSPVPAPGELPVHGGPLPAALRSAPAFGASVFGLPGAGCMELASPQRGGSSRVVTFEELKRAASSASSGGVTRSAGGGHAAVTSAATFSPSIDSAAAGAAAPPAAQLLSRQSACGALALNGGLPAMPLSGLTGWQPPRLPPFNAAAIDATADITLGNNKAGATGAACQQEHLSPTLATAEPFPPGCYPVIPSPGTVAVGEASGSSRPAASPQPPRGSPGLSRHLTSGVYRLGPDVLPAPRASHPGHAPATSPPQARGLPAPTAAGAPPLPSMISMLDGGEGRAPAAGALGAGSAAWPAVAAAAAAPVQQVGWDLLLNFPGSGADGSLAMALEPSRGSLSGSSLPGSGQAAGPGPMALGDSRVLATVAHGLGMLEGAGEAGPCSYDLIDALLRSNNNSWEELGAAQQVALMDSECANFLC